MKNYNLSPKPGDLLDELVALGDDLEALLFALLLRLLQRGLLVLHRHEEGIVDGVQLVEGLPKGGDYLEAQPAELGVHVLVVLVVAARIVVAHQ